MPQLTESDLGLPDFITMTNYCESLGYEVEMIRSRKGITCDVYLHGALKKIGAMVFNSCLEAQKESYTKLYKVLNN
jgi:hypothetical protein